MKRILGVATCLILVSGLAACGDDNNDDGGGGGSSLDFGEGSTVFGTLSEAEKEAACQEVATYMGSLITDAELKRASCTATAIFNATLGSESDEEFEKMCLMARDECIADETLEPQQNCNLTELDEATCTATNDEMEACLKDFAKHQSDGLKDLECSDGLFQLTPPLPSTCQAVKEKCPAAIGEDS